MNTQPNFNAYNQSLLTNFCTTSFSRNPVSKQQPKSQIKSSIQVSSKTTHYVKMILLSLGVKEERIQPHRNFYNDFDFDILMHVNMIFLVESYFNIFITDEEAEKITTIQELEQIIQSKFL
ncbi:acyl carrier protein [Bernardetia sp. OM2101]|uniref:acyl carrier protein n=1 Tax=Bernardetia sp. OM2101 TaxID=3344876 RepID=UPI0035CEC882